MVGAGRVVVIDASIHPLQITTKPKFPQPIPPFTHKHRYDYMQLFHHGACLIGMWACWSTGRSGADCTFALFVAELANPFMYLRYLLREVGWHSTPLARTNQVRLPSLRFVCVC